jgi:hypothetical protein
MSFPTSDDDRRGLAARLQTMISASWMAQATYVAAYLCLPDLLAAGPRTSLDLANASGTHPPALHRLLRALATLDLVRERDDGAFELTPLGGQLRQDVPGSLRAWTLFWGGPQWRVWGHLVHSVQTGETARRHLDGTQDFQHIAQNADLAALFNQAMVELTRLVAQDVSQTYDFAGLNRIVDVGGGSGELLAAVLLANPHARGVLFDMAHAREAGQRHLAAHGLSERCEVVTGSFFEAVPGPAEALLLKSVLHDWDDAQCRAILENCGRALAADGRLLIVERLMPERVEASPAHQTIARSDIGMLVGPGGRERTEAEFGSLLAAAGLGLVRVFPLPSGFAIMEAVAGSA